MQLFCVSICSNKVLKVEFLSINENLESIYQIQFFLTAISNELILKIFYNLNFLFCFRLSLISKRLWKIDWLYIQQKIIDFISSWVGARIICLNNKYEFDNWSIDLLTTEEKNVINRNLNKIEIDSDEIFSQNLENLFNIIIYRFREIYSKIEFYQILFCAVSDKTERPIYSKYS